MSARGKAFLSGPVEGDQIVSFKYASDNSIGTSARVSYDKDWVWIVTDEHEGCAMLHIECLPKLRKALANIAREIRRKRSAAQD